LLRQIAQLAKLVDDLRATLDGDPGAIEIDAAPFAPVEVLAETIEEFRERYAAANLAIDTAHLQNGGWRMRGDADRLHQVFINLLENTLRYTHAGGGLTVTSEARQGWLMLQFDDTAPAPRPEALPRIFDRFFRAEPSRSRAHGGSGLGLAICKALIEAHGGKIAAAISPRGGLTLNIRLPLERT
jgi:two-component system sensor histidine kinase BaeS